MANLPAKVILDTNLWISYLISSKFIKIDLLLEKGAVRLIFSEELIGEFVEVANRPKFRKLFTSEDVAELLSVIDHHSEIVTVHSLVDICRDPKDNFLLALAKDSRADYLVTGDQDLLILKIFEGTKIVTITDLENELK